MARFEGTPGADRLVGGEERDTLRGLAGDDSLYGGDRDDRLIGGGGDDRLYGGAGGDRLIGGAGRDEFIFEAVSDSVPFGTDNIIGFESGRDKIVFDGEYDLIGGLHFIGKDEFSGTPREVRFDRIKLLTHIYIDIDGDMQADAQIDFGGSVKLHASDFLF